MKIKQIEHTGLIMGKSDGFKSIKVISFDGLQENYREWRAKTEAIVQANNWWDQILDSTEKVLKIKSNTTSDDEKLVLSQEKEAKMYLTLACENVAFQYIVDKKTAYQMYTILQKKYEPADEDE